MIVDTVSVHIGMCCRVLRTRGDRRPKTPAPMIKIELGTHSWSIKLEGAIWLLWTAPKVVSVGRVEETFAGTSLGCLHTKDDVLT